MSVVASQAIPEGYKQTDIGILPFDWKIKSIGEFATVSSGGTPNRKVADYWNGDIPWVTTTLINGGDISYANEFITAKGLDSSSAKMCKAGSILMAMYGQGKTRGKAGVLTINASINQACVAIDINTKNSKEYILQTLNYMYEEIRELSNSGGQENLSSGIIKSIKIPLPPEQEQTAIANALSDVDALLTELENLIAKKQMIKTATMQQLLTGKTRLPQFATCTEGEKKGQPKGAKPSELGEIPEDWDISPLSKMLKDSPKYGINAAAVPLKGNLPVYIRITDISEDGYFKPTELVGVNSPFSNDYQLENGDIVLARTGASVGKSYLYNESDGKLVYAGFLIKVSSNKDKLKPEYLFQYLKTDHYWSWVTINSMRSGQPGINGNEYGQLPVPIPRIEEQTAIATILSDMDNEIQTLEQRLKKTRQIKQGMMQELFTGRTRLPL
jgi:type I restriction enzyme S subunit